MPAIDFKEKPVPTSGAERDRFELFAREFLSFRGYKIIFGPDRGPDAQAGRDDNGAVLEKQALLFHH